MNCRSIKYDCDKLKLVALGDVHFGGKECDEKLFLDKVNWIKKQKDCAVILMGDMINCGTKVSVGAGAFDDDFNPEEQYEMMLKILKPISDKIVMALTGNHEERIRIQSSFDITKLLSRELDIYYAKEGSALMDFKVKNQHYIVHAKHGSTGSGTPAGKMNGCLKMADNADADIFLQGHVHSLQHNVQMFRRYNLKNKMIDERERHFVLTGAFLDWDGSYGELKGYSPLKKGMPTLHLNGDRFDVQVEM